MLFFFVEVDFYLLFECLEVVYFGVEDHIEACWVDCWGVG